MKYTLSLSLLGLALIVACQRGSTNYQPIAQPFEPDYALDRFEAEIKKFEKEDTEKSFKKGEVLFYGSSSWRIWKDIKTDLAPLPVLNRGFGGSTIPELTHYVERVVFPRHRGQTARVPPSPARRSPAMSRWCSGRCSPHRFSAPSAIRGLPPGSAAHPCRA